MWSEVIRQVPSDDPSKAGQLTFEDPDLADTRMLRAVRAEGKRHRVYLMHYCLSDAALEIGSFASFSNTIITDI